MSYQAPNWVNGKPPAINATRLNNLCSTVQTLDETMPTKQNKLTFDNVPTSGSSNPVKSGGIKTALDGKAAASHTHSASDIVSGILPVARGGTGKSTALGAITALGGLSAADPGTSIAANTDLNDLITPGTYCCPNSTRAKTLINAPLTSAGFKMFVVGNYNNTDTTARVTQYVMYGRVFRCRDFSGGASDTPVWSEWSTWCDDTHTHSASDIVSGILPVARGGTGNSTGYVTAGKKSGTTLGQYATAEGNDTTASGVCSHAEGDGTTASGWGCHAEGQKTIANASNQMDFSNPTNPYGSSHAEGFKTTASGEASHAEGSNTKATGMTSHAEGIDTTASGVASHAEGMRTIASGNGGSHAEGVETTASGVASHAEGEGTIAHSFQHVFGKYNVAVADLEGEKGQIAEIVGWGTSDTNRKTIRIMDIYGNMTIAGTLTQSSDSRLKTVEGEIPDVSEIHAVRFRWNDVNGQHDDLEHIGYIAQDVEKVAPFMVKKDSNGYKALDYIAFLCAKMELLERRVKELEEKKE